MRLPEDYEERSGITPTIISAVVAVTLFIGVILAVVLMMNEQKKPSPNKNIQAAVSATVQTQSNNKSQYPDTDELVTGSTLSPKDFDFWDMYPNQTPAPAATQMPEAKPEETQEPVETDPSKDGKHTLIKSANGKEEWVLISPYLPKHEYDFTKLVCQSNIMKYYEDGKQVSYVGTDISKYQDYVDFVKLKKAGIDFVMIRVGARGYGSGQIVIDEYFLDNIKRATDAGLEVGVYFFSQAITVEEAVEEANVVLENIKDYKVSYPVAFDMEHVDNDTARIDNLTKTDKTTITQAFLDTIRLAGYKTVIYGEKEWLIKEIDMSKLTGYDVWLAQTEDIPDYPYQFTMWQYSTNATLDGIAGYANLNISFIDYAEK